MPVVSTVAQGGVTLGWNRAWRYFSSYPQLQSLFILNNDVAVPPGAFMKLHRALLKESSPGEHCLLHHQSIVELILADHIIVCVVFCSDYGANVR